MDMKNIDEYLLAKAKAESEISNIILTLINEYGLDNVSVYVRADIDVENLIGCISFSRSNIVKTEITTEL